MNDTNEEIKPENQAVIDRLLLKQQRKERKEQKKCLKRIELQREMERKKLELKLGPKDNHVTIISRELIDKFNNLSISSNSNDSSNLHINNFPAIGEGRILNTSPDNITISQDNNLSENECNVAVEPRSQRPITVNIIEILEKPEAPKQVKFNDSTKLYDGNILDASQPERHRGKHRENPRPKHPSKLKSLINKDIAKCDTTKHEYTGIHSPNFEIYCDNLITDELNEAVAKLLTIVVAFQENLYKRDPAKAVQKRRIVVGLREVQKYLKVNKVDIVIIAPNIKNVVPNGALDNTVRDIMALSNKNNKPYVFALHRRKLGQITLKFMPISCVAIMRCAGAEEAFKRVLELLEIARNLYQNIHPKSDGAENLIQNELVENLLKTMK